MLRRPSVRFPASAASYGMPCTERVRKLVATLMRTVLILPLRWGWSRPGLESNGRDLILCPIQKLLLFKRAAPEPYHQPETGKKQKPSEHQ